MNGIPTIQEEIERKSLETLEKLALDHENGRITEAQYSYGLDILWSAVAGLAGSDFTMMIEVAKSPTKGASFLTKQYYLSEKGRVVRLTNTHTGIVCCDLDLGLSKSRKVYDFRDQPHPTKLAQQKYQSLCDNLVAKGFQQI